jgi:hypothetical protein
VNLGHVRSSAPKDHTHDEPVKSRVELWQQRLRQEQSLSEQEKAQKTAFKQRVRSPRSQQSDDSQLSSSNSGIQFRFDYRL